MDWQHFVSRRPELAALDAALRGAVIRLELGPGPDEFAAAMRAIDRRLSDLDLSEQERAALRLRLGKALDDRAEGSK